MRYIWMCKLCCFIYNMQTLYHITHSLLCKLFINMLEHWIMELFSSIRLCWMHTMRGFWISIYRFITKLFRKFNSLLKLCKSFMCKLCFNLHNLLLMRYWICYDSRIKGMLGCWHATMSRWLMAGLLRLHRLWTRILFEFQRRCKFNFLWTMFIKLSNMFLFCLVHWVQLWQWLWISLWSKSRKYMCDTNWMGRNGWRMGKLIKKNE